MAEIRNLAWFYKPEQSLNYAEMEKYSYMILTNGDQASITQIRADGYTGKIYMYIRGDAIQQKNTGVQPNRNQAAWTINDWDDINVNHTDWFLLDQNSNRILASQSANDYWMMDWGNAGWRNFFITRVNAQLATAAWDGIFMDNIECSLAKREQEGGFLPISYATDSAYNTVVAAFGTYVKANIDASHSTVLGNMINTRSTGESSFATCIAPLDGGMVEAAFMDFHTGYRSASQWTAHKDRSTLGKKILYVTQFDDPNDLARQQFGFCSYLLVADVAGNISFRHATASAYNISYWYSNYDYILGQPLGAATLSGTEWSRSFDNAVVKVDPTNHTSSITFNSSIVQIKESVTGASAAAETNHVVHLPPGTKVGDLVFVMLCNDTTAATLTWPAEFTHVGGSTIPSAARFAWNWLICAGTEPWFGQGDPTMTVTSSASVGASWLAIRIQRHDATVNSVQVGGSAVTGTDAAPDPNSQTPAAGAKEYLWMACVWYDVGTFTITAPAGWSNFITSRWNNAAGTGVALATRNLNAATMDPPAFTLSGATPWAAKTISVPPGSEGSDQIASRSYLSVAHHIVRKR